MLALALVLVVLAVALVARLVTDVRNDRPVMPPRSHTYELDPQAARLTRVPR